MFNLFPRKKSVDEILEDAGLPTEELYNSIKKEASDLASGLVTGVYEIIALKNELQYQIDENTKLKKENEDLKLMSKERDNKWRTFNRGLHAQIKGLKKRMKSFRKIIVSGVISMKMFVRTEVNLKQFLSLLKRMEHMSTIMLLSSEKRM